MSLMEEIKSLDVRWRRYKGFEFYEKNKDKMTQEELDTLVDIMKQSSYAATMYARNVLKARWPEAEPYIANGEVENHALIYVRDVIKGRFELFEKHCKLEKNKKLYAEIIKELKLEALEDSFDDEE